MPCTAPSITLLEPFRPLGTAPTWKKWLTLLSGATLAQLAYAVCYCARSYKHLIRGARLDDTSAAWLLRG